MISCINLTVCYGKKQILNNISFLAEPSQITVILGKNGSGKSTLFKALTGNLPYNGSIALNGREVSELPPARRARLISMMPQMLPMPGISVRELVSFGRQPYTGIMGILGQTDKEKIDAVMEETGIAALAECPVARISGGERQKAYFAMMLAQDTPVLLLDEPGAHLDAEYSRRLAVFLRSASHSGKTVLTVLHDINRALDIADKIIVIGEGHILFEGSATSFSDSAFPQTVFGLKRYECSSCDGTHKKSILFK